MFDAHALRPIAVRFPPCGVFVLESHHVRGFRMAPTRHGFLKVLQPVSGAGWLVRGQTRTPLAPADVVLVPAGERHHIEDEGARPLALYALCVADTSLPFREHRHFPAPVWAADFRSLFRQMLLEQTLARPGGELMLRGLAWQALAQIARATSGRQAASATPAGPGAPTRARVAAYARGMETSFFQRQTLDGAARSLGLSRRRFTQLFRQITGESWLEHLQRQRLAHARRLLRETRRSVASIGYECGFEDLTTFYRAFKAVEHTSPLAWRTRGAADQPPSRPQRRKTGSSTPN